MKLFKKAIFTLLISTLFLNVAHATIVGRLGTSLPDNHPLTLGANKFAELVKQKTSGEVEIKVYANGVLGNDVSMTSMVQAGTLDFTTPSTATLASLENDFTIVSLPFIFKNRTEVFRTLDSEFGQNLLAKLERHKLIGLAFFDHGFRQITNNIRPINKLEDLKGIKLRVMENKMFVDFFKNLGATPVAMSVNELYTALETRTVDGQENPYIVIDSKKMYEVQKFLSVTNHSYDTQVLIQGEMFGKKLNAQQQQAIKDAAKEAQEWQRKISIDLGEKSLATVEKYVKVNQVSDIEISRFQEHAKPMWESYRANAKALGFEF